jgi:vesicle-fusing ATPase
VSPQDFPPTADGSDIYILINGNYVLSAKPTQGCEPGEIGLTDAQRTWAGITLGPQDMVTVQPYDVFSQGGGQSYLGGVEVEVGFAARKTTDVPYDQDELATQFKKNFENQILAPGQQLLLDVKNIPLRMAIRTVQLADLSMEKEDANAPPSTDPRARGILTRHTQVDFFKDARTDIKLKASTKRPAANAIIQPGFKFEDMGIGGLDTEFSAIFRRAFASRIFPPGLVEKLGIQHVRGILLFGPPGTGKTLIARQIGKMLNAREPKVINGPEVLNKYVGQSEENIRKLFADAEKEYKEKGDESGLHIIIFDELDAVCKQRGSGSGGTGVGDSVVNQLLSKLDGVDQLNNILLIGMTNRMDMIDEALLRAGRLEVHMEISLPDESGRAQILKIHTTKMRKNDVLESDVNVDELAKLTKNFSGAELNGLVKAASSFAFSRHIKVGTMANIDHKGLENMKVNRQDFFQALDEVKPLFGASEEELGKRLQGGIIHYSEFIKDILDEGRLYINQVRKPDSTPILSVALHGPPGSGKTAMAARMAIDSGFPFIKLVSPEDMVGFSEMQKVQQLDKTFRDAYKSPLSVIVIDNIEMLVDWVPIGPRFSNTVLVALKVLLAKQPPKVSHTLPRWRGQRQLSRVSRTVACLFSQLRPSARYSPSSIFSVASMPRSRCRTSTRRPSWPTCYRSLAPSPSAISSAPSPRSRKSPAAPTSAWASRSSLRASRQPSRTRMCLAALQGLFRVPSLRTCRCRARRVRFRAECRIRKQQINTPNVHFTACFQTTVEHISPHAYTRARTLVLARSRHQPVNVRHPF